MTETREQKIERLEIEIQIRVTELNKLEHEALDEEVKALGFKIPPVEEQLNKIFTAYHDAQLCKMLAPWPPIVEYLKKE